MLDNERAKDRGNPDIGVRFHVMNDAGAGGLRSETRRSFVFFHIAADHVRLHLRVRSEANLRHGFQGYGNGAKAGRPFLRYQQAIAGTRQDRAFFEVRDEFCRVIVICHDSPCLLRRGLNKAVHIDGYVIAVNPDSDVYRFVRGRTGATADHEKG